jgi:hypothetical protein
MYALLHTQALDKFSPNESSAAMKNSQHFNYQLRFLFLAKHAEMDQPLRKAYQDDPH